MARILGTTLITDAVRDHIWARRSSELVTIGLKVVDEGEFQIPAPDQLASRLPQVVVQYRKASPITRKKSQAAFQATHHLTVNFLRLLGDTEPKNVTVRQQAELIANLFLQVTFQLPGYTPSALTKVLIEECSATALELEEGFLFEDLAEIEHASIPLEITATHYDV